MTPSLRDRFRGCLLGLAVGDAIGGRFEAQPAGHLRSRFSTLDALFNAIDGELWYTDDAQMTIGVAQTLLKAGRIDELALCNAFASNYVPSRGYGRGARAVLEAMAEGRDYVTVASAYFPGGSYGNGAAMRVAPVGLFFRNDPRRLLDEARASAVPTHLHTLGIEGAQLIALAVAYATTTEDFDRNKYFEFLLQCDASNEFRERMAAASRVASPADLAELGNGIAALDSVPTAIAAVALTPGSYINTVGNVVLLGGDTDTIAAMAGAISGALLGVQAIPSKLLNQLEESPQGRSYLIQLADELWQQSLLV